MQTNDDDTVSLADAISVWAEGVGDDEARADSLLELLNYCADAAVHVLRDGDTEAGEALAEALVPLRLALRRWPAAAQLPPYGAFLGCLQALLRGDAAQLARLHPALDEGLAGALERIVALVAGQGDGPTADDGASGDPAEVDEPDLPPGVAAALESGDLPGVERALAALPEHERGRALAALRRRSEQQVARMSPAEQRALALHLQAEQIARTADDAAALAAQAIRDGDPDARRRLAIEMGQAAAHYAKDEPPGSPYDDLAAFLRAVAALLRGTPVPRAPAAYAERLAAIQAAVEEQ